MPQNMALVFSDSPRVIYNQFLKRKWIYTEVHTGGNSALWVNDDDEKEKKSLTVKEMYPKKRKLKFEHYKICLEASQTENVINI